LSSISLPNNPEVYQWLSAFGFTCLIEIVVGWVVYGWITGRHESVLNPSIRTFSAVVLVANLATHPLVYLGIPRFAYQAGWSYGGFLAVAELFAFATEALIYWSVGNMRLMRAVQLSFLANILSWSVGLLIGF
jgi:hypothetical protein